MARPGLATDRRQPPSGQCVVDSAGSTLVQSLAPRGRSARRRSRGGSQAGGSRTPTVTTLEQRAGPARQPASPRRRWRPRTLSRAERRGLRTGLLFISPWLVGFFVFTLYPALASLYYSFTNFKILQTPRWVGLDNYANLLKDPLFWKSLQNTLYLTLIGVPLSILVALGVALLLNNKRVRGLGAFRPIFYLPGVIPAVAASLLWIFLLNPSFGLLNETLALVGIHGPGWYFDPARATNGLILLM